MRREPGVSETPFPVRWPLLDDCFVNHLSREVLLDPPSQTVESSTALPQGERLRGVARDSALRPWKKSGMTLGC